MDITLIGMDGNTGMISFAIFNAYGRMIAFGVIVEVTGCAFALEGQLSDAEIERRLKSCIAGGQ
jgi:hypothetical protein